MMSISGQERSFDCSPVADSLDEETGRNVPIPRVRENIAPLAARLEFDGLHWVILDRGLKSAKQEMLFTAH